MEVFQQADLNAMLLWIIAATVSMLLLVLAGVVLSARAFTQLAELIRFLGSLVAQLHTGGQQVQTTSLPEKESDTPSSHPDVTPTTWESPKSGLTDGIETTKRQRC